MIIIQTIAETLNPEWNETLIITDVTLYGNVDDIKESPPVIIIELFDEDAFVSFYTMQHVIYTLG